MLEQPPVLRYRSVRFRVTQSIAPKTLLLHFLLESVFVLGLWGTNPLPCPAGENLWLDVARSSITTNELHHHVSVLADDMLEGRETGTRGGREAAKYILKSIESTGLKPSGPGDRFTQPFSGRSQNLLAVLEGTDPELRNEVIVVGAHYDHVGYGSRRNSYGPTGFIHNGADDNASGVAALLEVIDAISRSGHQPKRSILFAFWDGEEKGLLGSKHWLRNPTVPLDSVKLTINIDMVGRLTDGRIELMGARTAPGLRQMMSTSSLSEGTWVDFTWNLKDNSDHWPFYERRIPCLCVHTGLHDDYHRPSDDIEKLNLDGMREVSRYLVERLCDLADAETLPGYRTNSRGENLETQKRVENPLPAIPSRLGFTWEYIPGETSQLIVQHVQLTGANSLRSGDIILAVNGLSISNESLLPAMALQSEAQLDLKVLRAGTEMPVTVTVPLQGVPVRLGLSWRENDAEPETVYSTRVVPYSPAARAGIVLHDRIYSLNGEPITGQADLLARVQNLLAENVEEFRLEIESRGSIREVVVSLRLPSVTTTLDATL